jgi:hypothetical protein
MWGTSSGSSSKYTHSFTPSINQQSMNEKEKNVLVDTFFQSDKNEAWIKSLLIKMKHLKNWIYILTLQRQKEIS